MRARARVFVCARVCVRVCVRARVRARVCEMVKIPAAAAAVVMARSKRGMVVDTVAFSAREIASPST